MATSLMKICNSNINLRTITPAICISIRHGHHLRGKPPGVARNLQQRLDELNYKDPKLHFRVDIGLPPPQKSVREELKQRAKILSENHKNADMELKARKKELLVDLKNVKKDWSCTSGQHHIKKIADHYGVFEHLFGDAYFIPRVPLDISYKLEEVDVPVYYGNVIKPKEAQMKPRISYESDDKSLWTLIMTNPDSHFTEQKAEYVHWFLGNIPGSKINNGETIVEYMQPFPPKGTGYHRHIFILYKQNGIIDFSNFKKQGPCLTLSERTFSTLDFYRERQDILTPAGLAFFQSDWDASLKAFFHDSLGIKEPIFEYDFPPPYISPQKWFPIKEPFNLYMDKYRDPKQINKEFLMRKLQKVNPFKAPEPPLPYPNAQHFEGYIPTWLKLEMRKSRLKWGRVNDV